MKKITKRIIFFCCVFYLCVSIKSYAYNEKEAIEIVKDYEFMTGTGQGFEEEKGLTRAEISKIAFKLAGYTNHDYNKFDGKTIFSDVDESNWASKYIQAGTYYGLVQGVGDGIFAPNKELTVDELITICCRVLGAESYIKANINEAWPNNYRTFANYSNINLLNGINKEGKTIVTRGETAIIVANTLNAERYGLDAIPPQDNMAGINVYSRPTGETWGERLDRLGLDTREDKMKDIEIYAYNLTTLEESETAHIQVDATNHSSAIDYIEVEYYDADKDENIVQKIKANRNKIINYSFKYYYKNRGILTVRVYDVEGNHLHKNYSISITQKSNVTNEITLNYKSEDKMTLGTSRIYNFLCSNLYCNVSKITITAKDFYGNVLLNNTYYPNEFSYNYTIINNTTGIMHIDIKAYDNLGKLFVFEDFYEVK